MLRNLVRTLIVVLAVSSFSPVFAQLGIESVRQINLLIQEKNSRTPAQKKMDSRLLQAAREKRGLQMVQGVNLEPAKINEEGDGRVKVDINADVTDELLNKIRSLGGTIIYPSKEYHTLRAIIKISDGEIIAGYSEVKFIQPAVLSYTVGSGTPALAKKNDIKRPTPTNTVKRNGSPLLKPSLTDRKQRVSEIVKKYLQEHNVFNPMVFGAGAANSQGDHSHRADDARNRWGYAGQGIKIGVLSDSYNRLGGAATDVLNADLPGVGNPYGNTTPVTVVQDFTTSGNDEGRAMLQIIHDLAPKAQLYFATGNVSEASFANNIVALRTTYGCDIVIDDLGYYDEPAFQDGIVAQAVSTVTSSGGMYFSSAGNEGSVALGTAGVWEGDFNDVGSPSPTFSTGTKTGSIHNFGSIPADGNELLTQGQGAYNLQWSDPWGASNNDYDLFLIRANGTIKSSSTTVQNGTQNPYEVFGVTTLAVGDHFVVFRTMGAATRAIHLNTNRGTLKVATTGQTHGHSCVVDAYCVAATPATGVPFTSSSTVESFSSDGLRRIFYNVNGTEITPGNVRFSTNGGTVRNKPDVTAADGVSTTLPASTGLNPFFGTSAAAPHAGAIAALLKSANPAITPAQVRTVLTSTAVDIQAAGYDNVSGYGILRAYDAMQQVNPGGLPYINLGTTTFSEGSTSNSNGSLEPGETGNLVVQLNNSSLVSASNVVATITSTTPGVTITQGSSNYGTINSSASATNTATPFTFGVSSSIACGSAISFQIKIAFDGGVGTVGYTVTTTVGQLFTVGNISSTLGSPPPAGAGYTVTSGQQTGRLVRGSTASTCAAPVANPGLGTTTAGARQYDAYTFTNSTGASRCYTVTLSSSNGANIYTAAYNSSGFVPSNPSTNYIAEPGQSGTTQTYSFTVAAGSAFTVVVHDINVTPASNSPYTLSVTYIGCAAPPACATITVAPPTIAGGATGTPYTQSFTASGGSGSYTYSLTGTLPAGLSFSGNTLSGTPLEGGTYPITITAADAIGCTGSKNYSLVITGSAAPIVTVNPGNINYLTVKGAFDAINAGTHTGTVTVNINGSTTETAPAVLNASGTGSASYTSVLIHPTVNGLSVSGSFATNGVIELNDADNVTIDGSTTGGTATAVGGDAALRNLTVKNTSTTATAGAVIAVKHGTNGAQNVTIKNVTVLGQDPTQTLIGIQIGGNTIGSAPTVNNNNITIENCDVQKAFVGIYDVGTSPASPSTGHIIRRNNLSSTGVNRLRRVGIFLFNHDGIQVTENKVGGIVGDEGADAIGIAGGIQNITNTTTTSGGIINSTISKNIIDGIASTSTVGFSASGIAIAGGTGTNSIINNMVSGITAPSTDPDIVAGIFVAGVAGSSTNIFYNTVSLSGDRGSVASQIGSYGIAITGTNPTVTLKDNIFATTQTSAGGANAKSYALGMTTTTFTNLTSDYNDFFFSGANAAGFRTGSLAATGTDYTTLAAWRTATGKDANSVSVAPVFVSPTDLHLVFGSNPGIENKGTPITSPAVTTDIDGDTRNVTTPDIGADEVSAPICSKVHNTTTGLNYCTIQEAIDAPATLNGHTLTVDAGTYTEKVTVTKRLTILGANAAVNPCTGTRVAESIILPPASQPFYDVNGTEVRMMEIEADSVVIKGFTFDGDNPALTARAIDAADGIDVYVDVDSITIQNNIFKNINEGGINAFPSGSTSQRDNFINDNKFDNIPGLSDPAYEFSGYGIGVLVYNNFYTTIDNNCMTNVRIGVQTGNYNLVNTGPTTPTINSNQIQSKVVGIFHNLAYSNASAFTISGNNITTVAGATKNEGIEIASILSAVGVTVSNNNVTGARIGYDLWNCPTNTVTISGGTLTNCKVGVFANNYDGYDSDAASSVYNMTGITTTNCDTAVWVRDNVLNSTGTTVALNIDNATNNINGSGIGVLIEGKDASVALNGAVPINFSTSLTKYFRYITNGTDVPAGNITATGVQFGGVNGAGKTLAELFAIEDKIDHKIDWSPLGFVLVKASNDYVTTNSFYTPNTTTAKVQRGVDASSNGFTVNVADGSYRDSVVVNKEVTITGQSQAGVIVYPNTSNPIGSGGTLGGSNLFTVKANNVTINTLTADGDNPSNGAGADARNGIVTDFNSGDYTNLTVHHTTVKNIYYRGIYSAYGSTPGQTFNFHHNTVSNVKGDASSIGIFNYANSGTIDNNSVSDASDGIAANQSTGTVFSNNTVTTSGSGIHTDNNGGSGGTADMIKNNTITNSTPGGLGILVFVPSLVVTVQENTITNVDTALMNAGQDAAVTTLFQRNTVDGMNKPGSRGVYQTTGTFGIAGSLNVSGNYINNFIKNNDDGFYLEYEAGQTNTITANNNSITGNTPGVTFAPGAGSAGTLVNNFECNWWGTANAAAVAAAVGAPVDYTPYLTSGTDAAPATPGFQPAAGSCNGLTGDSDGDGVPDENDCAPFDPLNTTQKPKLSTSINNVTVNSNNDGVNDQAAFSVGNTPNNIVFNYVTDQNMVTGALVYQVIQKTNVTVPFCNNCSASPIAFTGSTGTASLINPNLSGTLVMKFVGFIDGNGNGQLDAGECKGDSVIYTVTVNPNPNPCVNDNTPPVIVSKNATIHTDPNGNASVQPSDVVASFTDNCGVNNASLMVSPNQFNCPVPTSGDGPHQAYVAPTNQGAQDYGGELGMDFKVNEAAGIVVSQLGAFDDKGDGITGTQGGGIRVAIFKKSDMSIVPGLNVVILTSDTYTNNYRFRNVVPVTLPVGDYVIVAKGYNANERNGNKYFGSPIATGDLNGGAISYTGTSRYGSDDPGTFSYPNNPDYGPENQYLAGTFIYSKAGSGGGGSSTYTVTITGSDVNGNPATPVTAQVTVICDGTGGGDPCANDNTPPVLVTKNATKNADVNGNASITASDVVQSVSDNCAIQSVTVAPNQFTCATGSGDPHQAYVAPTNQGSQTYGGELGMEFRVNNAAGITISQLGAFDDKGDGLFGTQSGGIRVAVFKKSDMTIVTGLNTVITTSDPYLNNYRFKNVAPVTLAPGDYVIVAKGYNINERNGNKNTGSPIATGDLNGGDISYIGTSRYGSDDPATFSYPANPDFEAANQYLAGTFIYSNPGSGGGSNTHTVTVTATDTHGNMTTATATVTIVCNGTGDPCDTDNTSPILVTKNITIPADNNGNAAIVPDDVIQSLTDNCGIDNASKTVTPSQFTCNAGSGDGLHQAYVAPTNQGSQDYGGELGMDFRVNNPAGITISQLGAFDDKGDGIFGTQSGGIRVAVFRKSDMTIVPGLNVVIVTSDPYTNNYRFKNVAPVTLTPGDYVIVAKGYNSNERNGNKHTGSPIATGDLDGGAISYIGTSRYGSDNPATFSYPNNPDFEAANQYLAGTFVYTKGSGGSNTYTVTVTAKDLKGNQASATATVTVTCNNQSITTNMWAADTKATNDVSETADNSVQLYPNPTRGRITVRLFNMTVPKVTIQILSETGSQVAQKAIDLSGRTVSLTVPFDLGNQPPGMYFVKVLTRDGTKIMKVVLMR